MQPPLADAFISLSLSPIPSRPFSLGIKSVPCSFFSSLPFTSFDSALADCRRSNGTPVPVLALFCVCSAPTFWFDLRFPWFSMCYKSLCSPLSTLIMLRKCSSAPRRNDFYSRTPADVAKKRNGAKQTKVVVVARVLAPYTGSPIFHLPFALSHDPSSCPCSHVRSLSPLSQHSQPVAEQCPKHEQIHTIPELVLLIMCNVCAIYNIYLYNVMTTCHNMRLLMVNEEQWCGLAIWLQTYANERFIRCGEFWFENGSLHMSALFRCHGHIDDDHGGCYRECVI